MKKKRSIIALGIIAALCLFASASFLRENWSAAETPGAVETFFARWILNRSHGKDAAVKNPHQATADNLEKGRRNYETQCAFCHGSDGQGQDRIQFYPPVPRFDARTAEKSDGHVQSIINQGIRYTAMPSFSRALTVEETWKVVLWVRRLAEQQSTHGTKRVADQPER